MLSCFHPLNTIFLGTTNFGKITEFSQALAGLPLKIETPQTMGLTDDVEEIGDSFEAITRHKAQAWAARTQLSTLVDDSGLGITALNGWPGTQSKRWFPGSDAERNQALLDQLIQREILDRSAYFVSVLAFYDPVTGLFHQTRGQVDGRLAQSVQGNQGFGYDPLFIPTGYQVPFGQLGLRVKATLSHRARALAPMIEFLQQWVKPAVATPSANASWVKRAMAGKARKNI